MHCRAPCNVSALDNLRLLHRVFGVVVDRPESVAAGGVVGPSAGNAFVARRLGPGLAVGAVVDAVVVHIR